MRVALLIVCLLVSASGFAQELNCKVSIQTDQIRVNQQRGETQIFNELQAVITEFLNGRRWTNDQFSVEEKINCNLAINLLRADANGNYEANATMSISRPVYGTNYETTLFRYVDRSFNFKYQTATPLNYNDNSFNDNLTSTLAFYAYIVLAFDYDSFGKMGGNLHVQRAYNVMTLAQQSGDGAWSSSGDTRNKYWLVENLQSQQMLPFRDGFYTYHRLVLDNLLNDPESGRKQALDYLKAIQQVNQLKPASVLVNSFFDTKGEELTQLFSEAPREDRQQAYNILISLDPTKTDNYKRLIR
jgi:hypothetical protein